MVSNPAPRPLRLGYCDACSPAIALAVGPLPSPPKHYDPRSRSMHEGKTVDIDDKERPGPGEPPGEFLARMLAKYAAEK